MSTMRMLEKNAGCQVKSTITYQFHNKLFGRVARKNLFVEPSHRMHPLILSIYLVTKEVEDNHCKTMVVIFLMHWECYVSAGSGLVGRLVASYIQDISVFLMPFR